MNAYSSPSVDAGRLRMRTCSRQLRPAGTYYAARFSVSEEEELLCLRRLYSRDGDPLDLRILRLREERAALCLEREYLDSEGRVIALQRVLIPEGGEEELIVER